MNELFFQSFAKGKMEGIYMPRRLKIAYTERAFEIFGTVNGRDSIKAAQTDFTDTSALIITDLDGVRHYEFVHYAMSFAGQAHCLDLP